jgi:hypothetical protein
MRGQQDASRPPSGPVDTSTDRLRLTAARFRRKTWPGPEHGVCPLVTIANASAETTTTDLRVDLHFPPAYVGYDLAGESTPHIVGSAGPGWRHSHPRRDRDGTTIALRREAWATQLAPRATLTLGCWELAWYPFSIGWLAETDEPVTVTVSATGFSAASAVLVEAGAPLGHRRAGRHGRPFHDRGPTRSRP